MSNIENFQVAHAVRCRSNDILGRLAQIQSVASNSPERAGCQAIAIVCETTRNSMVKEWQAFLAVGVALKPHVVFEMGSTVRDQENQPVFLSIEAFRPASVEPVIFGNDKEKLITWHSEWVRSHAEMVWSLSLPVFAVIAHMALHERTRIEEMTASRVVFLSRGPGCRGWAMVTIDLTVAEQDAAFMNAAVQRLESRHDTA